MKKSFITFLVFFIGILATIFSQDEGSKTTLKPFNLQDKLVQIKIEEFDLTRQLEQFKSDLPREERLWSETRQSLQMNDDPSPYLVEKVAYHWARRIYLTHAITALENQLFYLEQLKMIWTKRYQLRHQRQFRKELEQAKLKNQDILLQLEQDQELAKAKRNEIHTENEALKKKMKGETLTTAQIRWMVLTQQVYENHDAVFDAMINRLNKVTKAIAVLNEEIEYRINTMPISDRIYSLSRYIMDIWHFEITKVENTSITIGKIILSIFFFILGFFVSRFVSTVFIRWLLIKFRLARSSLDAIQKLLFYVLIIIFALLSLQIVQVPITFFTFLGGALAIGFGFGSQNIMNNFISGLILLMERPIKIGDYVEIEGVLGEIDFIGMRSTRFQTPDNIHLVIPNSSFLEKNVINWTLSDKVVRRVVKVGVAYGSPTQDVKKILLNAAENHELILKDPEPQVFFTDFGDNALAFEILFWIRLQRISDRRRIESDLRFMIDNRFRKANITISYPQRDVHLDTLRPLQVEVISPIKEEPQAESNKPSEGSDKSLPSN